MKVHIIQPSEPLVEKSIYLISTKALESTKIRVVSPFILLNSVDSGVRLLL